MTIELSLTPRIAAMPHSDEAYVFRHNLNVLFNLFRATTRKGSGLSLRISTQGFVAIYDAMGDVVEDIEDDGGIERTIQKMRSGLRAQDIPVPIEPDVSAVYGRFTEKYGRVNGYRLEMFHDGSGCVRNPRGAEVCDFRDTREAIKFI